MAFARGLFREQLERAQDMALSCMVLSSSLRHMSREFIRFWVSAAITLRSLTF